MKRKSLIAVLAALMVLASAVVCFADGGLKIVSSYPQDGQKNTSMENLGVKIVFNNKIDAKSVQKYNASQVSLVDEKGVKVPIKVLFSEKGGKMMLAVADLNESEYRVLNNAEYTLNIASNFRDNEGNTLGQDEQITFKTYNQKANNWVNMGMMAVMFGGLFLVSMKSATKREEEQEPAAQEAFNPYKEAKRTGKSLEEVKAEQAKKEAKLAKKKARKGGKEEAAHEKHIENCAELLNNVYHVHAPAPTNKEDRSIEALRKLRKSQRKSNKKK